MRWSVAATAAPRPGADYLPACVASIAAAGWSEGVIYAEPGTPNVTPWRMAESGTRLRQWPNFQRALLGCLADDPDAVAIFQDDCLVAGGCRLWLESQSPLWQPDIGLISLYTSQATEERYGKPGWFCIAWEGRPNARGAVAVVLPRAAARLLAESFRLRNDCLSTEHIDYYLDWWAHGAGLKRYWHSPSLARHVGRVSAISAGKPGPAWTAHRHEGSFAASATSLTNLAAQCS